MAEKFPVRRVFFVLLSVPEEKTAVLRPDQATRYMIGEVGSLRAQWQCACRAELGMVEKHATNAQAKMVQRHWRSVRLDDHANDCEWRQIAEAEPPRTRFSTPTFKQQVQDGFAVILSLNQRIVGADYRYAWLHRNNIPQHVLNADEQRANFGGRHIRVSVKEFGGLVKTLDQVVDLVGNLDHVYLEYRGGMRPVKRIFQRPGHVSGRFFVEAVEAAEGLTVRQKMAENREKNNFREVALFPELLRLAPSGAQMRDIRYGEIHGPMSQLRQPAVVGRGYFLGSDTGKLPGATNYTHDILFSDYTQRAAAVAGLKSLEPVWALGIPRVQDRSWFNGPQTRKFNAHIVVMPDLMRVGALPSRVLDALQAPYRDMVRHPQMARQTHLSISVP